MSYEQTIDDQRDEITALREQLKKVEKERDDMFCEITIGLASTDFKFDKTQSTRDLVMGARNELEGIRFIKYALAQAREELGLETGRKKYWWKAWAISVAIKLILKSDLAYAEQDKKKAEKALEEEREKHNYTDELLSNAKSDLREERTAKEEALKTVARLRGALSSACIVDGRCIFCDTHIGDDVSNVHANGCWIPDALKETGERSEGEGE